MSNDFSTPTLPPIGWVANLREDDRELLASYGQFLALYPPNELIFQGDEQHHLFLLISGKLEVRREGRDNPIVVGTITPGECIGEVALFDPGPASATVVALEFSQIWKIDQVSLNLFLESNPVGGNHLMVGLATILSNRLRHLNAKMVELSN